MKILCIFVSLVVAIKAHYHDEVGIPLAARIKAYEDKIFANGSEKAFRIVGGEVAPVFEHPYMAGLIIRLENKFISTCGSSLVSDTRLVTAAHCLDHAKSIKVVFETVFLYHGGTRIITRKFAKHPKYHENRTMDYDIGVVKLPPVKITETLHPIHLPISPNYIEVVGEWATAAGWGLTSDKDRGKQVGEYLVLHQVNLKIIPEVVCLKQYRTYNILGNSICTDGTGGVAVCDGDSGGPLYIKRSGQKTLVGVVSHGHGPCEDGYPSVFTRVLPYKKFILRS